MLSEFPFLYRFTVLLNSGGSNSPWSEFWSEFPHFMGMGVVPASLTNTSAKVLRYKREPYRDTHWWCIYYFCQEEGILFQKYHDRNERCIAILL